MTDAKYRNYQEFYANYLGGWSFAGGDQILTIKDVYEQEVRSKDSGTELKLTLIFEEADLPMVLNRTNADMIAHVTGSNYTQDWIGKKIKVGTSRVKAFGDVFDAIRVRDEKITTASTERCTEPQYQRIMSMIEAGVIDGKKMLAFYGLQQVKDLSRKQAADLIQARTGEVIE